MNLRPQMMLAETKYADQVTVRLQSVCRRLVREVAKEEDFSGFNSGEGKKEC